MDLEVAIDADLLRPDVPDLGRRGTTDLPPPPR